MKNCAIICEYNPFHTGHLYQLQTVKNRGVSDVFCIMSGAFVQSGMPSFCDKAIRAECAVLGGATAVIELPVVYATASAQTFAEGALKIISEIKNIGYLAMGAVGDTDSVLRLAEIKTKRKADFEVALKTELKSGKSYNAANFAALTKLYSSLCIDKPPIDALLKDPNNILCIEYIAAIDKYCGNIEPMLIQRRGALHNDTDTRGEYVSATAIRNAESDGNIGDMAQYIPFLYDKICNFRASHSPNIDLYKKMAVYAVKRAQPSDIAALRDCSEGMEFLIKNMSTCSDFDGYVDSAVCRRYGKKRIYRLFLDLLLGIDKPIITERFCTRLLACKKDFDFSLLPTSVKTNNADIKLAAERDEEVRHVLTADLNSVALYNTLCDIDGDYYNYSLVKV